MTTILDNVRAGRPLTDFPVIDMHGHMGRYNFGIPDITSAALVRQMDRAGVQSVIVSHMHCMTADPAWGNRQVLEAMRACPGRILGYLALWPFSAEDVRQEAESCFANGFTGIKIHNCNGFPYTHPAYDPAYEIANARRAPVLFHTWGGEEEFAQTRELAARYPEISFLMAHAGAANEAGYISIATDCPNVYLDPTLSRSPLGAVDRLVAGAGADKVVFGSDVYFFSQFGQIGKVAGARISEDEKRLVLSGNAQQILGRIRQ